MGGRRRDERLSLAEVTAGLSHRAAEVDATAVIPEENLQGLAEAGLYGAFAPTELGGLGLDYPGVCSAIEELAAACLATTFVWIQHFGLLRAVLDPATPSGLRDRFTEGAVTGTTKGGIALAGLLPGPPRLTAAPAGDGWILDGEAPWVTGWGIVDVVVTTARGPEETLVTVVLDGQEQPGLSVSPHHLGAVNASRTVTLNFDGFRVGGDRFVSRRPYDPAQHLEGLRANGSLALGLVRRCCTLIGPSPLDAELDATRAEMDTAETPAMPAARARACELAARAASALAVHRGSRSALAGDEAERAAREASFLLVFGSRPAIKESLIAQLTR